MMVTEGAICRHVHFTRSYYSYTTLTYLRYYFIHIVCLMARLRRLLREYFVFLLTVCPNLSRLTVYTGLRVNLKFLTKDYRQQ